MRTEKEMLDLVLNVAAKDERVRVVAMNGSRTNPNVPKDHLQDYDVVFVVTQMEGYINDPSWIDVFGKRIILQMPEAMTMFPPELGNWFSYLMLFEDGTRIDLILVPLDELDMYIKDDKLIKILLDKDGRVPPQPPSTDVDYWVKRPTAAHFDDCCNEFWWLSTYVAKGLWRNEPTFAIDHLTLMRSMLFTMVSWEVGFATDFSISVGKNYKYLKNYLEADRWQAIMQTYNNSSNDDIWASLHLCCDLFRTSAKNIAAHLNARYPEYDEKVTPYLKHLQESL